MALTKLEIRLEAETTRLQKDLDKANRRIKKWAGKSSRAAKKVGQSFKKIGFAAGIAAGGMALLVKNSLAAGDALAKTADKLGTTTEKLAGLQHAAEITGVAQATLNKALTKQQKAIFDADRGLLTYSQHFDKLGLSTAKLMALDPVDQFKAIGEALKNVENQTDRTAIAYDVFGGRGTALLNTLALGKDGLEDMAKEAEVLGIALSRVDAAKMEEANDTFVRMKGVVKGVGNSITIALSPVLDALGKQFVDAAKESGGMVEFVNKGMNQLVSAVGFVMDAFHGLSVVWKGLEVAFAFTANVIIGLIDTIITPFKVILEGLAPFSETAANALMVIEATSTGVMNNLIEKQAEFQAALAAPPPSEGLKQWVADVQAAAQQVAEAKAASLTGDGSSSIAAQEAETQKLKESLISQLDSINTFLMTKQETETLAFENRQFMIEDAFQNEIISYEKRNKILEKLEKKHKKAMTAIEVRERTNYLGLVESGLGAAVELSAAYGESSFANSKALATAQAIVSTYSAAMKQFDEYNGGYAGTAAAAIAVAFGMARVQKIQSTSIKSKSVGGAGGGGGGVASDGGGSVTTFPGASQAERDFNDIEQRPTNINITIEGGVADRDTAEAIADSLRQYISDGGRGI